MRSHIGQKFLKVAVGVSFFLAVGMGLKPTFGKIMRWHQTQGAMSPEELRLKLHSQYPKQIEIIRYIKENMPGDDPILIQREQCAPHTLNYYLAPRRLYLFSEDMATRLKSEGVRYYVLSMRCEEKQVVAWSIYDPLRGAWVYRKGNSQ